MTQTCIAPARLLAGANGGLRKKRPNCKKEKHFDLDIRPHGTCTLKYRFGFPSWLIRWKRRAKRCPDDGDRRPAKSATAFSPRMVSMKKRDATGSATIQNKITL